MNTILLVLLAAWAGWAARRERERVTRAQHLRRLIESARGEGNRGTSPGLPLEGTRADEEMRPTTADSWQRRIGSLPSRSETVPTRPSPALSWCPSCGEPMQDGYCANCAPLTLNDFDTTMAKLASDMQRARDGLKVRALLESVGLTREVQS